MAGCWVGGWVVGSYWIIADVRDNNLRTSNYSNPLIANRLRGVKNTFVWILFLFPNNLSLCGCWGNYLKFNYPALG